MSRFENKLCPVCRIPFTEKSDVVVCPECGTPHHRACYLAKNRCALEEYHAQGFSWNGYLPDEEIPAEAQTADEHHEESPSDNTVIIENKDNPAPVTFDNMEDAADFLEKLNSDMTNDETVGDDGVSLRELCAYASKSVFHYGQAFGSFRRKIGGRSRKIFLNICAGLFAPVFQFYRKMDLLGIILTLVWWLFSLPTMLAYAGVVELTEGFYGIYTLCNFLSFALTVVLCLFGDYFYYRRAVKQIKKIRAKFSATGTDEYYAALEESGRPSWLRAIIGILIMMILAASINLLPQIMG